MQVSISESMHACEYDLSVWMSMCIHVCVHVRVCMHVYMSMSLHKF